MRYACMRPGAMARVRTGQPGEVAHVATVFHVKHTRIRDGADFEEPYEAMGGCSCAVHLIDSPLHELLPCTCAPLAPDRVSAARPPAMRYAACMRPSTMAVVSTYASRGSVASHPVESAARFNR